LQTLIGIIQSQRLNKNVIIQFIHNIVVLGGQNTPCYIKYYETNTSNPFWYFCIWSYTA